MKTNNSIPGSFFPFGPNDFLKTQTRTIIEKIANIWDNCVAPEKSHCERESVALEDMGVWGRKGEAGYYIKIKLHSADRRRKDTQEKGRNVLKAFEDLFPHKCDVHYDNLDSLNDGGTVTLVVHTYNNLINIF